MRGILRLSELWLLLGVIITVFTVKKGPELARALVSLVFPRGKKTRLPTKTEPERPKHDA